MRTILFLFLTLISGFAEEATSPLRIVTWNLQWFPGGRLGASKEEQDRQIVQIRDEIKKLNPDILLLQEVASEGALKETLEPLGKEWQVAVVSRFMQGNFLSGQQIAIAAKIPAESAFSESWKEGWAGPPRGYSYASFMIRGKRLAVYSLHLKSNLGNPTENTSKREDAIEQLIQHTKETTDRRLPAEITLIGGDFNTDDPSTLAAPSPGEITFDLLKKDGFHWSFEGIPHKDRITCPAKGQYPPACFDYFFTKGAGNPRSLPAQATGSDHLPVILDLKQ